MEKLVESCSATYLLVIVTELVIRKKWRRFLLEAIVYLAVLALALLINNATTGVVAFGPGTSPVATIGIMLAATILGTAARFIFYLEKGQFSWLDLLKPVSISPMVLLPLIGSVQATGELSTMQIISFSVLAFQNGFFWQAVLAATKPTLAKTSGS